MTKEQIETMPLLKQFLAENKVRCPKCRKRLRGAESGCCPRCDRQLQLGLIWSNSFSGWWAASLYGTALATLLLLLLLARLFFSDEIVSALAYEHYQVAVSDYGGDPPATIAFVVATLCTAGSGAFAAYVLTARRLFAEWAPRVRWIVSVIAISSPLLVTLLMYLVYRFV